MHYTFIIIIINIVDTVCKHLHLFTATMAMYLMANEKISGCKVLFTTYSELMSVICEGLLYHVNRVVGKRKKMQTSSPWGPVKHTLCPDWFISHLGDTSKTVSHSSMQLHLMKWEPRILPFLYTRGQLDRQPAFLAFPCQSHSLRRKKMIWGYNYNKGTNSA